jgi:hypothetical protein
MNSLLLEGKKCCSSSSVIAEDDDDVNIFSAPLAGSEPMELLVTSISIGMPILRVE